MEKIICVPPPAKPPVSRALLWEWHGPYSQASSRSMIFFNSLATVTSIFYAAPNFLAVKPVCDLLPEVKEGESFWKHESDDCCCGYDSQSPLLSCWSFFRQCRGHALMDHICRWSWSKTALKSRVDILSSSLWSVCMSFCLCQSINISVHRLTRYSKCSRSVW